MKRNVIYFPYIEVPNDEWFTRVLLYWDNIYSIIPSGLSDYINKNKYMHKLIEAELVQPVNPGHYIEKIPNYREAFLEYVDNPNYSVPHGISKMDPRNTTRVHIEKLGDIGPDLVHRGLARRRDWNWYDIDDYTANQFMAYLASVLGKLPEIESEPITDSIQSLNSFSPINYQRGKIHQKIDEMRTVILKDILPAPSGGINPEKLAEFKSEHHRELVRFRNKIESFLLDAVAIDDPYLRSENIEQFITETRDDVTELSELMKSKGFRVITLGKFLGYSSLLMGMGSAVVTGSLLEAVAAAFGASKVIHDAIQERRSADLLEGRYTAYAILAPQKLQFFNKLFHSNR